MDNRKLALEIGAAVTKQVLKALDQADFVEQVIKVPPAVILVADPPEVQLFNPLAGDVAEPEMSKQEKDDRAQLEALGFAEWASNDDILAALEKREETLTEWLTRLAKMQGNPEAAVRALVA